MYILHSKAPFAHLCSHTGAVLANLDKAEQDFATILLQSCTIACQGPQSYFYVRSTQGQPPSHSR